MKKSAIFKVVALALILTMALALMGCGSLSDFFPDNSPTPDSGGVGIGDGGTGEGDTGEGDTGEGDTGNGGTGNGDAGEGGEGETENHEHTHTLGEWGGNTASCTEGGYETAYCTYPECDYSETRDTDPLGHNFVERVCSRCAEVDPSEGLEFVSYGDGRCYVSGIGECKDTVIYIPSVSPEGDAVVEIGNSAFDSCTEITSVTIPDGVTIIGHGAFSFCYSLKEVIIPDSVNEIGRRAFAVCWKLENAKLPEGLTQISTGLFERCESIGEVIIPSTVTEICDYAFSDSYVTGVVIPEGVKTIGMSAFWQCTKLTEVTIPEGVTSIGDACFDKCNNLKKIVIPDSVTKIGAYTFRDCSRLTIYCEAESQPSGWDRFWNYSKCDVVWGFTEENSL